jgi:hypothetical protein
VNWLGVLVALTAIYLGMTGQWAGDRKAPRDADP